MKHLSIHYESRKKTKVQLIYFSTKISFVKKTKLFCMSTKQKKALQNLFNIIFKRKQNKSSPGKYLQKERSKKTSPFEKLFQF